ncbi:MAG: DNA polymerase, partial [Planctomycetota bacterium]
WKKKDYIFKGIINELYQMKIDAQNAGNKALRSIAKIIINSTYGFFGINYLTRDQTEIIHERASKTKTAEESRECRYYGYLLDNKLKERKKVGKYDIYKLEDSIPPNCANVAIASAITSNARLELYKLLSEIDNAGGKVYYCDTDSAITDYNIYEDDRFKDFIGEGGDNLGELTNETEEEGGYYTDIITLGNKAYALRNPKLKKNSSIIKLKGIKSKQTYNKKEIDHEKKEIVFRGINKLEGKEKLDFNDYILLSNGYTLTTDNMTFITGSNSILLKDNGIIKQRNKKSITSKYDKAVVDNEGFITPLCL